MSSKAETEETVYIIHTHIYTEVPMRFTPGWHSGDAGVCLWAVHGATELRVFTVVAFCAAWNGGGVLCATAEINTSVPAGVYLFPNPRQRFALRIWPGTIQVSRSR